MSEWKPIEAAPKNGQEIIGGKWHYGKWIWGKIAWFSTDWIGMSNPTHYISLPEPPK